MPWTPHRGVAIVGSLLRLAAIVPAAVVSAQTLTVDQASLALFAQAGGQPASRIISVGGQGSVTVSTSTAWLSVNLRGGFTPNLAMVMADSRVVARRELFSNILFDSALRRRYGYRASDVYGEQRPSIAN